MATNNNEMKIAETTTFTNDKRWDLVLNRDSSFKDVNCNLINSAINLIIANTTNHKNVTKDYLDIIIERLTEMFKSDGCLNVRNEDGKLVNSINFSKFIKTYAVSELTGNLIRLINFISKFSIWFEDTNSDENGRGFCCKNDKIFFSIIMETETEND